MCSDHCNATTSTKFVHVSNLDLLLLLVIILFNHYEATAVCYLSSYCSLIWDNIPWLHQMHQIQDAHTIHNCDWA